MNPDDRTNLPYTVQGYHGVHTVVSADYHRNGVGGDGFVVALIDTYDYESKTVERFLLTWFKDYSDPETATLANYQGKVSVLNVSQIAAGNINMYPATDPVTGETVPGTGGAAYRGADNWAQVLPVIERFRDDERAMRDRVFAADLASRAHAK